MSKLDNKLFKEAIADAKAVKSIALKNAQIALQEAFTPTLQSMISNKIREDDGYGEEDVSDEVAYDDLDPIAEMPKEEDNMDYDMEEEPPVDDFSAEPEAAPVAPAPEVAAAPAPAHAPDMGAELDAEPQMDDEFGEDEPVDEMFEDELGEVQMHPAQPEAQISDDQYDDIASGEDDPNAPPFHENATGEEFTGEDDTDHEEITLESVLAELESDLTEDEDYGDEDYDDDDVSPKEDNMDDELTEDYSSESDDEMENDDEEVNLEELISEILSEEDDKYEKADDSDPNTEELTDTPEVPASAGPISEESHNPELGTYEKADEDPDVNFEDSTGSDKSAANYDGAEEMLNKSGKGRSDADYDLGQKMLANVSRENAALKKENVQYKKVYKFLRSRLNEINLLNAKLLFINKLFKEYSLNHGQKRKIVESFDYTKTVREAKLVYATLAESFNSTSMIKNVKKKNITEGARKAVKSTKPKMPIVEQNNNFSQRMQQLAGIIPSY